MAVKLDDVSVKDDEKIVTFVAFCIECYKTIHGISGHEAADLFRKYGVEKYLYEEYDILHSFGERQIVDDIERFIEVRKGKERL